MKEPHWAKLQYDPIDYQQLYYYAAPKQKKAPSSLKEVDKELLKTYEKLGIPLKEQEALAGVVAVDAVFDSVSVAKLSNDELAHIRNTKIGFVFQSYNLLPRTTCIENAELPLFYHHGISSEERQKRAIDALNLVGLQQRLLHTPNQLSGGQQQRVAIARALVNDPVVIFADEATGNLDTRMSYEIMGLFQDLNRQGKTIVFVTHEPDIARMSKRTITLRDGLVINDEVYEHQVDAKEELAKLPITD